MIDVAAPKLDFVDYGEAVLVGGRRLPVRPIRPDDAARLKRMFYRLSRDTVYLRFFSPVHRPPAWALRHLSEVDYANRFALVALDGDEIVGVARFDRSKDDGGRAEVAVVVEDALQGRGLGRALLQRLSECARARGVEAFAASMLAENRRALSLASSVPGVRFETEGSETLAVIPLEHAVQASWMPLQ